MKITFLGGADEVGASSILIETGGRRLLVDGGIRPSPKARWGLAGDQLPHLSQLDALESLDAILVTHAHTDHTGALELVSGRYPHAPVYATPPTLALMRVLHQDARRIMRSRFDEEGELPLFDDVAVERLVSAFQPVPFHTRLPLGEGVAATFFPAGHIAGAAMIGIESEDGRLLISGDLSISPQRTVDGARTPPFRPNLLIIESTYGGRLHANRAVQEHKLIEAVAQVVSAGGKVLIPAFALGRAQEILLILGEAQRRGDLPAAPIWADGMVRAICQVYTSFADVLPLALQERGAQFFGGMLRPVQNNEQRNALIWETTPAIIVASSGMLAGGPSLSYARALASSPQHAILLTGYQDEESPGRRLQEVAERGSGSIRLGKDKIDVQCRLGIYSLSAHADEGQLISLVEALDAPHVALVHGDAAARNSLEQALGERGRIVHLPRAGQALEFHFRAIRPLKAPKLERSLDIAALWSELSTPVGGFYLLEELAVAWWGDVTLERLETLRLALAEDALYFSADETRGDLYRIRLPAQVKLAQQRRQAMAILPAAAGRWLVLQRPDGSPYAARCTTITKEHLVIEDEELLSQIVYPEEVLALLGEAPPSPDDLRAYQPQVETSVLMEPNQALVLANSLFPPVARLRKSGYRLAEHTLALTFDFPDAACQLYAAQISSLAERSGWQVEIIPEANQNALNALVREVLPPGWSILKGPAIYREKKRVAATVAPASAASDGSEIEPICAAFLEQSGYRLDLALAAGTTIPVVATYAAAPGERLEINAAYAVIKAALDGSSLYRTSLKGDEIVLSFISAQVGERSSEQIAALSQQTGWPLSINPNANQGTILELVRAQLSQAGWQIAKGPGVYPEKGEVLVSLVSTPPEGELARVAVQVEEQTGFRLVISLPQAAAQKQPVESPVAARPANDVVEIPIARIRISRYQQGLSLDPAKLDKIIQRARRMGQVTPPIRVRRLMDGYLLLDGLYRLKAAQALGLEKIWVEVDHSA